MSKSLTTADILNAYASGVFPMSEARDDPDLFWVRPDMRGILPLDGLHIPRSLKRAMRRGAGTKDEIIIKMNTEFRAVMHGCAGDNHEIFGGAFLAHPERNSTWINDTIFDLYTDLHDQGFAHSVECWQNDKLVGGLYGIALGRVFFGESMFTRITDASKMALVSLVTILRYGGFQLLDTQFITDHLSNFGVIEIPRDAYEAKLNQAVIKYFDNDESQSNPSNIYALFDKINPHADQMSETLAEQIRQKMDQPSLSTSSSGISGSTILQLSTQIS